MPEHVVLGTDVARKAQRDVHARCEVFAAVEEVCVEVVDSKWWRRCVVVAAVHAM
jgi:hypothetical protein